MGAMLRRRSSLSCALQIYCILPAGERENDNGIPFAMPTLPPMWLADRRAPKTFRAQRSFVRLFRC